MSAAVFWPLAFVLWIAAALLVSAALERREWIFRYKCTLCNGRPMIATEPVPTSHLVGGHEFLHTIGYGHLGEYDPATGEVVP